MITKEELIEKYGVVYNTSEATEAFKIQSFQMCMAVATERETGDKVILDFTRASDGNRYYWIAVRYAKGE